MFNQLWRLLGKNERNKTPEYVYTNIFTCSLQTEHSKVYVKFYAK